MTVKFSKKKSIFQRIEKPNGWSFLSVGFFYPLEMLQFDAARMVIGEKTWADYLTNNIDFSSTNDPALKR
jgi:hypothetical protein